MTELESYCPYGVTYFSEKTIKDVWGIDGHAETNNSKSHKLAGPTGD